MAALPTLGVEQVALAVAAEWAAQLIREGLEPLTKASEVAITMRYCLPAEEAALVLRLLTTPPILKVVSASVATSRVPPLHVVAVVEPVDIVLGILAPQEVLVVAVQGLTQAAPEYPAQRILAVAVAAATTTTAAVAAVAAPAWSSCAIP